MPVLYEMRIYHAAPGKMAALQARFRDHTMRLFERHGMKNIAYWTNRVGGRSDELIYVLAYDDMGHRERAWRSFAADPEWQQVLAESDREGVLNLWGESRLMAPTDFSPLQ